MPVVSAGKVPVPTRKSGELKSAPERSEHAAAAPAVRYRSSLLVLPALGPTFAFNRRSDRDRHLQLPDEETI